MDAMNAKYEVMNDEVVTNHRIKMKERVEFYKRMYETARLQMIEADREWMRRLYQQAQQ
ncbi:hypothetical protein ACFVS2_20325 [Brevibacillus sp. NPDC058079]|uniref:hypothetical protein n=1 Tax=Brevibacillus sp. NPDC058079 TaxID=3346330 RepID=UPI0036E44419